MNHETTGIGFVNYLESGAAEQVSIDFVWDMLRDYSAPPGNTLWSSKVATEDPMFIVSQDHLLVSCCHMNGTNPQQLVHIGAILVQYWCRFQAIRRLHGFPFPDGTWLTVKLFGCIGCTIFSLRTGVWRP